MKQHYLIFFAIAGTLACSDTMVEGDDVRADTVNAQTPDTPDDPSDPVDRPVDPKVEPGNNNPIGNAGPNVNPGNNSNPDLPDPYKGWAFTVGGQGNDWPKAVASDADGNVFVGGSFESAFTIDGVTIAPQHGSLDAFIVAFDKDGDFLWHVVYGSAGNDSVNALTTDASGNVYVAGEHNGELRIGGVARPAIGALDAHAFKLASNGTLAWVREFGGDRFDSAKAISVSEAGHLTVVGSYINQLDLTQVDIDNEVKTGDNDVFVASFDVVTGAARWVQAMAGFGSDIGTTVASHSSGSIVVGVSTQWGLQVGSDMWPGDEQFTVGLVSYDADGNLLWKNHVNSGAGVSFAGLQIADDGSVYGVGSFQGAVDFGTTVLDGTNANFEAWVASWTSTGEPRWAVKQGGNSIDQGMGITLAGDRVFAVGRFTEELVSQGMSATSKGGYDIFVAELTTETGDARALLTFGGVEDEQPGGIAFDGESGAFVSGYTRGTFEFDGSSFAAPGQNLDVFVVRARP